MGSVRELIKLCRPQQWYKNLVIFIAIFFKEELFDLQKLVMVLIGFVALSLISSGNYIINDFLDREKDRLNPEKRKRPLAAGTISSATAIILATMLLVAGGLIGYWLGPLFFMSVVTLFLITLWYSLSLKTKPLIDILAIAVNFVIRAISGTFIINTDISPWLIIGTFFLSIFLSLGKRISESNALKKPEEHRETLTFYSGEFSKSLMTSSTTILIVCFALYSFLAKHQKIIYTLPIFVFLIFRYVQLVYTRSDIPRHPELIYKDRQFLLGLIAMAILSATAIYF